MSDSEKEFPIESEENSISGDESDSVTDAGDADGNSEIEKWAEHDLARSGLTRDDMSIAAFAPERRKNGTWKNNGGYKIYYPDPVSGEAMKGTNGKIFVRKRFMPPLPDGKDGRRKYETAYGAGNRCYILPAVHRYLKENPSSPLYMTEGEKKAAKATKEGLPMIGLTGIWGWLDSKSDRNKKGDDYAIHPDIRQYLESPRDVYLIYDSDARETPEKTKSFDSNAERLAFELVALNCKFFRIDLPSGADGEKQGVDDYLLKHSVDELRDYIKSHTADFPLKELNKCKDPYLKIHEEEGRPFLIKYTKEGAVSSITFNQSWNAGFLSRKMRLLFEPMEYEFYYYEEKSGLWKQISEYQLKYFLSSDLAAYWKEFHGDKSSELLPRRSDRMLMDSINLLRGKIVKAEAFVRSGANYVVHLANGMLHIEKMQLRNFSPEYYSRNQIPFELSENAECPRFMNDLLYSALPEDDVDLLQRWAGTVLLGGNPTQQFMVLEGTPCGGKGTFAEVLEKIIGRQNVAELRTNLLAERFEFSAFVGKSLLCGRDVPGNFLQTRGSEAIKKLVGHDYLQAEHKRSNQRSSLYGDFALMVTSNSRLKVRLDGDTDAWRRRMMLVRYERPPVEKRIAHFSDKLIAVEGNGILLWMVAGAVKAMNEINEYGKILLNDRQQNLVDSLLYESDSIKLFIAECLEASEGWDVTTEELKNAYVRYCEIRNWSFQSSKDIERQLPDFLLREFSAHVSNNLKRDGRTIRGYRGVKIKNEADGSCVGSLSVDAATVAKKEKSDG